MFGILVSAFNFVLGWIFRGLVVKFVILTALFFVVTTIVNAALGVLDLSPVQQLNAALGSLPQALSYFAGVFRFDVGIPMVIAASLTAFIIRRLPIIG